MTEESADLGPGQQLKLARERKGLTVADISTRLKLNTWIIEGIEQDDYDKLPSPTFLRGYLRSYANLVELDGDQLVAAYNGSAKINVKPLSMEQPEVRPPAPPVPVARYLLVLLLLGGVLLATYWFALRNPGNEIDESLGESIELNTNNNGEGDGGIVSPEAEPSSDLGQPVILAGGADDGMLPIALAETIPDGAVGTVPLDDNGNSDADSNSGLASDAGSSAGATASDGNSNGDSNDSGASTSGSSSADAGASGDSAAVPPLPKPAIEPAEEGYVRLNFTLAEASWMQILERRSKRIVSGVLPPGDHEFVGRLPVRLKIGNAKSVTLLVDGQARTLPNRNVAKIKIFKKPVAE